MMHPKDWAKTVLWLLIVVSSGRISIDLHLWTSIPITGQSLAVILSGYFLGYKQLAWLYILYLGGGLAGFPFFADGSHGYSVLTGKSGGYLYSFPFAALFIRFLVNKSKDQIHQVFISFLMGTAIILLVGMLHLATKIGLEKAWTYGVLPYIFGGIVKCIIGMLVIWAQKRLCSLYKSTQA